MKKVTFLFAVVIFIIYKVVEIIIDSIDIETIIIRALIKFIAFFFIIFISFFVRKIYLEKFNKL